MHTEPDDHYMDDELDSDGPCDCMENPDSWESACIDDLCHGGEVPCMHGDYAKLPCSMCGK